MIASDAYVAAALELAGYRLDAASAARVATEFARIAAIAAVLTDEPFAGRHDALHFATLPGIEEPGREDSLSEHDEPLPVYRP